MGVLRCNQALADWESLAELSSRVWGHAGKCAVSEACFLTATRFLIDGATKREMAPLASSAAWHLGNRAAMEEYVQLLSEDTFDGSYYRAILATFQDKTDVSQKFINLARALLGAELRAMIGESYSRAYRLLVRCQQLSEMEEVIDYKRAMKDGRIQRQDTIKEGWTKRLNGVQRLFLSYC